MNWQKDLRHPLAGISCKIIRWGWQPAAATSGGRRRSGNVL